MNILVYGFKPYGAYEDNISEQILSLLKKREPRIITRIFPVRFDRKQFENTIKKLNPDVILGLGQYPRGEKIRIERKAVNLFGKKGKSKSRISSSGARSIDVSWKIAPDSSSWISYNARYYVCNFSMYVIGSIAQKHQIPFAFLHIPKTYSLAKATVFVQKQIQEMTG